METNELVKIIESKIWADQNKIDSFVYNEEMTRHDEEMIVMEHGRIQALREVLEALK